MRSNRCSLSNRARRTGLGPLGLSVALALTAVAASAGAVPTTVETVGAVQSAEMAFRRGDCGRAASQYVALAQRVTDERVLARAAAVTLDCGDFGGASKAAAHWRELAPHDPQATLASVRAAAGQYHVPEATAAFEAWLAAGGVAALRPRNDARPTSPRDRPGSASRAAPTDADLLAAEISNLAEQAGVPVTLALLRGVQSPQMHAGVVQLSLAALSLTGWRFHDAINYAQAAQKAGADAAGCQAVLARAYAGLGEAAPALAAAAAATKAAPKEQAFATAETLGLLGRDSDARAELQAMRNKPGMEMQALRRLGVLAYNAGDFDEAKSDFSAVLKDGQSGAVALYYLSAIAERNDEVEAAVRGYLLLRGTGLESAGKARAARLLFKQGQKSEALELLGPENSAGPPAVVTSELARADLLANGGAVQDALVRVEETLARFPNHPDLLYQKSVLLERAGKLDVSLEQIEALLKQRPEDPSLANALGYTLVDHGRELPRADRLIHQALDVEPDNPAILDSAGWLQFKRGAPKAALPLLERAFRLDADGDIGAHWGEVLWSLGDRGHARSVWNRALLADPGNAAVLAAQARAGVPQLPTVSGGTSI